MAVYSSQTGIQTSVVGTEAVVAQASAANNYQATVDLSGMINGDITEIRMYRVINGTTSRQEAIGIYANVQACPLATYRAASQGLTNGIALSIKQTAGTAHAYAWELLRDNVAADANVTQWTGTAVAATGVAGVPIVDMRYINGGTSTGTAGYVGVDWSKITAGTATNVLSNTSFSVAQIIASVSGAVGSVTGAVGSVTGNVGGNILGSVASVTALSAAAIQSIWDRLTSALTTVGSIGKLLVDNIDATISSRLASAAYTAPLSAAGTRAAIGLASANLDTQLGAIDTAVDAVQAKTDQLNFTVPGQLDSNIQYVNDTEVTGNGQSGSEWGPV